MPQVAQLAIPSRSTHYRLARLRERTRISQFSKWTLRDRRIHGY